ncbi:tumor necrosis factor receptor superfamily member 19 isoform X2 [Malaclemys terrapin pileata]|uniref:tumor necrosis factor receptor superfamily member 19 isoform X2 n=1 Tax=Malaclemys terrapin pileata TaxID=2991368 RepID=UPI0023A8D755|nr:tumor necrosis factor receptor superfamily member 19 isoform X2 [Malaclemys terrapin pileata]
MGSEGLQRQDKIVKMLILLLVYLLSKVICETGDCREQEFRDHAGNCILCKQCGPGMELSKECGFGYGEDAQCMTCRLNRFKEDWGFQKCKPCLDCAVVNRFQKSNCSATSNAVCGDCLPGFYRKTKLGGFQDMECVPCGDPPPPYEPHCTIKVNLVKIPSTASSPRDTALAAVICSALATVLLALLILCVIYCKRQFMEKKQSCPVHLIPSLCCDETCSMEHSSHSCTFHSHTTLYERTLNSVGEMIPAFLGSLSHSACGDLSDAWPLMQNPACCDSISFCESYPELTGGDITSFNPETENTANIDSDNDQDLSDVLISAKSAGSFAESTELSKQSICVDASLVQNSSAAKNLPMSECDETVNHPTD